MNGKLSRERKESQKGIEREVKGRSEEWKVIEERTFYQIQLLCNMPRQYGETGFYSVTFRLEWSKVVGTGSEVVSCDLDFYEDWWDHITAIMCECYLLIYL